MRILYAFPTSVLIAATVMLRASVLSAAEQPRNGLDALAYGEMQSSPEIAAHPTASAPPASRLAPAPRGLFVGPTSSINPFSALRDGFSSPKTMVMTSLALPPLAGEPAQPPVPSDPPPVQRYRPLPTEGFFSAFRGGFAAPRPVVVQAPVVYAAPPPPLPVPVYDSSYYLDAGDRLRIVVYGQEGLTNSYAVGASGSITMPLIGAVHARGLTPAALANTISSRLRNGFIRDPQVAAEIEAYRPFFILGEVAAPGQYPYVPNLSAESAVAIAGGFTPRARRDRVTLTHTDPLGTVRAEVPPITPINPGDTIVVGERWF